MLQRRTKNCFSIKIQKNKFLIPNVSPPNLFKSKHISTAYKKKNWTTIFKYNTWLVNPYRIKRRGMYMVFVARSTREKNDVTLSSHLIQKKKGKI